jgi:hypothetical protein
VTHCPHFQHFASPFADDRWLGAVQDWPSVLALLLLDCFEPATQQQLWQQVAAHGARVWILLQVKPTDTLLATLRRHRACLCATLSAKSRVAHESTCWSDAAWDVKPASYAVQLWHLVPEGVQGDSRAADAAPLNIPPLLGSWDDRRYDFHWC